MFCPQCGKENRDDMRFCYGCGFDLKQSAPPSSHPPSSHPSDPSGIGDGATGTPSDVSGIGDGATGTPSDVSDLDSMLNAAPGREALPAGAGGSAEGALAVGALVANRYKITRKLGQGGMGSVWLAQDTRLEQNVALKFIASDLLSSESARRRFLSEAKTSLNLTHANIIRVNYYDLWQNRMFLVMEYLNGNPLNILVDNLKAKKRALEWNRFAAILRQVLAGVEHAHGCNVIHRDLKPANIMIAKGADGKQRAVVMDFGLAKILDTEGRTRIGTAMGTPYYMAPEQHDSAAEVDARADLYSIGVIAYELLTTRIPMGRHAPASRLRSDLPGGVDDWIDKAMAYDRDDRFNSARAMREALDKISASPLSASPLSVPAAAPSIIIPKEQNYSEDLGNGVRIDMIWIPAGTFQMGSNQNDTEKPIHSVELDGFWLGKYPVTQAQYQAITGQNPSNFKSASNPVEQVNWDEATEFCRRISQKTGKTYCLPTEAQWEYACRAGANGKYCFGDSESQLGEYAWFDGNSESQTHPVGQKKPNQWGLFDMHGNVLEWCADWYGAYTAEKQRNPSGPGSGEYRVLRGGSWFNTPVLCRSAYRSYNTPDYRLIFIGFRLARTKN
ncbi:MAG: SUMF1/EgtB/PvdO family nonheme iron enzyme [Candidatus Sumerlaeota bacterium]|nr:SUMF1/EgtB/PvdO family nonheme iron enzyme [Candidatus Sumerlaeota bacterium]